MMGMQHHPPGWNAQTMKRPRATVRERTGRNRVWRDTPLSRSRPRYLRPGISMSRRTGARIGADITPRSVPDIRVIMSHMPRGNIILGGGAWTFPPPGDQPQENAVR